MIAFGVAPAMILFLWSLASAPKFGWTAALALAVCCALRLARFNVMAERETKAQWQSEYFVGVPAPAGAMLVLLPVYLGFLGITPGPLFGFLASGYTVLIGFLLVSRLPVWSGKSEGSRIRRDLVLPAILLVVLYVATLMSFTWETMVVTVVAYLATLPFGARSWQRKYGGWTAPATPATSEFPEETDGH